MKLKFYSSILFVVILILNYSKGFTQGTGNHFTMSLENCSYPAANIIQFDLMIVSDGASTSDMRLTSVAYGVNFDTCILQSGATFATTVVSYGDSIFYPGFALSFPTSSFPNHIRITGNAYTGQNYCGTVNTSGTAVNWGSGSSFPTGSFWSGHPIRINGIVYTIATVNSTTSLTLTTSAGSSIGVSCGFNSLQVGHKYRVGTFQIISSLNYTTCCPNFTLQANVVTGNTTTLAQPFIGCASSPTSFYVTGTGDGQRSVFVSPGCSCINGIKENNFDLAINIFPNPVSNELTLILPDNISEAEIKIFNLLGEEKYFSKVNERRTQIDISGLANGAYLIEMKIGNNIGRAKFVKF